MKRLLVTTPIESSWGDENEDKIFIGEWCKLYDRRHKWQSVNHEILEYHWNDRLKLNNEIDYLWTLHELFVESLSIYLNNAHKKNHSVRYWRIILGPWLLYYLITVFDRWEQIRLVCELHEGLETISLNLNNIPPIDYSSFNDQACSSDLWNHNLYLEIIKFGFSEKIGIKFSDKKNLDENLLQIKKKKSVPKRNNLKNLIRCSIVFIDKLLGIFFTRYNVILVRSGFSFIPFVKLNLALFQLPRLFSFEFQMPVNYAKKYQAYFLNKNRDAAIPLDIKPKSEFEKFLSIQILKDLPYSMFEGFQELFQMAKSVKLEGGVIASTTAHWDNELFKVWLAFNVDLGGRFIVIEHGGGFPFPKERFTFENIICDKKAAHAKPYLKNLYQLPFSKLLGKKFKSTKKYISVIGNEVPRYCVNSAINGPISGEILHSHKMVLDFYEHLDPVIQEEIRIKPGKNFGWNTRQRFIDCLGSEKVYDGLSYYDILRQSKIIVCTYPLTTLTEAIFSKIPTILLCPGDLWEIIPQFSDLFDEMKRAKIIFTDYRSAAEHLNRAWLDPDVWWNDQFTLSTRERYIKYCVDTDENWLGRWSTFLMAKD